MREVNNVEVNTDYPLVSAISMIAPSPDWFVGVRDYSLCDTTTGKWIDKIVKHLPLYDSGTDKAKTFVHTNIPNNPHVPILLITKIPEDAMKEQSLKPFGTFTFEKTFDSTASNVSPSVMSSSVAATTGTKSRSKISIVSSSVAAKTGTKSRSTKGNQNLIVSSSVAAMTGIKSRSITTTMKSTRSKASSVQHLGVFVFLKLIILNLFFTNILN